MPLALVSFRISIILGLVLLAVPGAAYSDDYPSLWDSRDQALQAQLEQVIKQQGLAQSVKQKQLSLVLVDITRPHHPRLAAVNGNQMVYAASLPKIAILLGAFVEIERGKIVLDERNRKTLTDMIRYSSNTAATRMLHQVGEQRIADILTSKQFQLYNKNQNGGLWVGKDYGKAKAWKRDPLHNLSHGATAMHAAKFYYMLETGRLVSPELTREMKAILADPAINHKFVKGLSGMPDARIYRKSGSWRNWHADSALIEHKGHSFIVVALAQNADGGRWLKDIIKPIHDLIVISKP